ncbi:NAD-dependent epimerase/dehydratase family protein [Microbacterium sp. P04]|uniref:NAD-dependent epimerase/dehydratase family protein n=1 Tax=Microbacterium sp. P04 TaxID=3366947 RepID=UPI003746B418
MRVVVVGASGNVGSAVLRRLHTASESRAAGDALQIVGVSRRAPDPTVAPYAGVAWVEIDIARSGTETALADVFAGADAVIHLAWALQPNHDEAAMRATNVGGTARVLAAVAAASVPHIVVASSVGAYSFGPKRRRVDESWPTGGIATAHYSRYKAANERALDRFEAELPGVVVTRVRPGLVFQADAGAEQAALFLGRLIPVGILRVWRPRVLPFPSQGIFQAVHADDLADAFWRIVERRAAGAFNIAAEPVLDPALIARTIGAKRWVPVRARTARLLVELTWRLRLQATDAGWVDIGTQVPVMSTARARDELGWVPEISATAALAEVVDAIAHRTRGAGSPPLEA